MIVAATLPLLIEHGDRVTTKQIAEAAGIAEGTIFRAFGDKDEVIAAAIESALDPAPLEAALSAIPTRPGVRSRPRGRGRDHPAARHRHLGLLSSVGTRFHEIDAAPDDRQRRARPLVRGAPRRGSRVEPIVAARLLRALTLSTTHPMLAGEPEVARRARAPVPPRRRR